ncbi:hypothetical protein ROG8370_03330 [Roseovarius gaetbuli]|uniref:Uncharacterized protein n=1 Tax=Roseovarius gaetbuli TaxID=1356575 RepID=A0A1X7A463_9RHOB|nr:hypothetical protein ROG8370_03330 [Roseovarius gaetbuli]
MTSLGPGSDGNNLRKLTQISATDRNNASEYYKVALLMKWY